MSADTVIADVPCFLHASLRNGVLTVQTSPLLRETDEWYEPVRLAVDPARAVLVEVETVTDPMWMFGRYELRTYVLSVP